MKAPISLRPYRPEDRHFVTDSFLRSFGRSAYADGVDARTLIDLLEPLLIAWDVTVAASAEDPGEMLGWCCHKAPDYVAWLFVKPAYRRAGVARALLAHSGVQRFVQAPFVPTKLFDKPFQTLAVSKGYHVRFRPFLACIGIQSIDVPDMQPMSASPRNGTSAWHQCHSSHPGYNRIGECTDCGSALANSYRQG